MEIVAFGVQADERAPLEKAFAGRHQLRSLDVVINRDTAPIAHGYEIVSSSVNGDLGADVLQTLAAGGTKMITQRSTGFNNIDLQAAADLGMTIGRVADYSPYAVAECIEHGIPFLAANVGGTPELIADEDRPRVTGQEADPDAR